MYEGKKDHAVPDDKKRVQRAVFEIYAFKANVRVFLADQTVAMVTKSVPKTIPTCSLMIGQFFDAMIVASTDKEWF